MWSRMRSSGRKAVPSATSTSTAPTATSSDWRCRLATNSSRASARRAPVVSANTISTASPPASAGSYRRLRIAAMRTVSPA